MGPAPPVDSRRKGENVGVGKYSSSGSGDKQGESLSFLQFFGRGSVRHEDRLAEKRREVVHLALDVMNTTPGREGLSPHELVFGIGETREASPLTNEEKTDPSTRNGEKTPPAIGSGEQNSSSSAENGENTPFASGKEKRMPRERRLRESRKTPFRLSPTPRGSNAGDEDLDAILEMQRLEDIGMKSSFPEVSVKRKRELLSDVDYRQRKERTDNLIEGLRQVKERSMSPPRRSSSTERLEPESKEKGEQLDCKEGEQEQLHKPIPDDFDPPPPSLGDKKEDSDSEDDFATELMREVGTSSRTRERTRKAGGVPTSVDHGIEMEVENQALRKDSRVVFSRVVLTVRQLRRVMAAKESLFKFGTFVPKSEREADASPEAPRWRAGRDLEWFRLREQGTFERDWTWARIQLEHSTYRKSDIGFLFYVYDYKFSGEHRVRLVFDGSRQSAETYDETYAPTARQE
jgi:hypothetical protein